MFNLHFLRNGYRVFIVIMSVVIVVAVCGLCIPGALTHTFRNATLSGPKKAVWMLCQLSAPWPFSPLYLFLHGQSRLGRTLGVFSLLAGGLVIVVLVALYGFAGLHTLAMK